ncbi:hypothetical protein THC_0837 [Caldimicrobium thiodismutans]|uniref:Transposase (putative) YhgA-like domain-containing protein n=1 Tax=Caldimicrobium thiodismutans TaxID=1653476 RepID=A0A0U5AVD6_9BACT|nr:Rpn family recombination-promoting nuclease/putative transposase [Caldimicrobium thiodismutans]BAU23224.1 hypothetical protein THC_0837 [Caldimicrobium thiodismutans]
MSKKKPPVPYDLFAKAFLKDPENLKAFLSTFLPEHIKTHLDLDSLKIIPEEQVSLSRKKREIPDLVAEVNLLSEGKPSTKAHLYILIEHKSAPDKRIYLQILNYITALNERSFKEGKGYVPVLPLVFYEGDKPWGYPERIEEIFSVPEGLKGELFKVHVVDLKRVEDEKILRVFDILAGLGCYLYLMKAESLDFEEIIEVITRATERLVAIGEKGRWEMGFLIRISEIKFRVDGEVIWFNILDSCEEEGVKMELKSFWDKVGEKFYKQGIEQGIKQGIEQGKYQGLIEDARELVLEAIEVKLGYVPEEVRERVVREEDRGVLKEWLRKIILAKGSEDIFKLFEN